MVSSLVDPTTGEVDWEELLWLARCAMLNVKPEEDIRDAFDDNTGRSIEVPDVHQRVVYGRARGVQVVSFRGTKCRRSFAINLDTRLERLESLTAAAPEERSGSAETRMGGEEFRARPGRPIHRGYARASRACGEAVRPLIVPDVPLVLTGHSLGGALATVLGMSLADEGVDVKHIVTWGAPKVGPQGCGSELDILRVSHADDLVVYLPPRKLTGCGCRQTRYRKPRP